MSLIVGQEVVGETVGQREIVDRKIAVCCQLTKPETGSFGIVHVVTAVLVEGENAEAGSGRGGSGNGRGGGCSGERCGGGCGGRCGRCGRDSRDGQLFKGLTGGNRQQIPRCMRQPLFGPTPVVIFAGLCIGEIEVDVLLVIKAGGDAVHNATRCIGVFKGAKKAIGWVIVTRTL